MGRIPAKSRKPLLPARNKCSNTCLSIPISDLTAKELVLRFDESFLSYIKCRKSSASIANKNDTIGTAFEFVSIPMAASVRLKIFVVYLSNWTSAEKGLREFHGLKDQGLRVAFRGA